LGHAMTLPSSMTQTVNRPAAQQSNLQRMSKAPEIETLPITLTEDQWLLAGPPRRPSKGKNDSRKQGSYAVAGWSSSSSGAKVT
jgi:hypothetical protein